MVSIEMTSDGINETAVVPCRHISWRCCSKQNVFDNLPPPFTMAGYLSEPYSEECIIEKLTRTTGSIEAWSSLTEHLHLVNWSIPCFLKESLIIPNSFLSALSLPPP